MLKAKDFYISLKEHGFDFFTGVPDSLLKSICSYVSDNGSASELLTAANEGGAIAAAAGHYLATGRPGLVYMQNSGLGNAMNPLISLAAPEVYQIPMLLLVGWRGEPGTKDEPQHVKQGVITESMLESAQIPYAILPDEERDAGRVISEIVGVMKDRSCPVALVVRKGCFEDYKSLSRPQNDHELSREEAIEMLAVRASKEEALILSTTGKISRELYECRVRSGVAASDFLNVGSMGHVSQIALGVSLARPEKTICCFDGDGAALMHMGGFSSIGEKGPKKFKHVLFNNGVHDSVGGQESAGFKVNFVEIASACGYKGSYLACSKKELNDVLDSFFAENAGPAFLEIRVRSGARKELGRPKSSPIEIRRAFMESLNG